MDSKELRSLMEAYQQVSAPQEVEEGVRDLDPEKGTAERKERLEKKRGMKMDDHPEYKKEEVEQVDENRAAMGRINKEYHRKKEAEAMAARSRDPKVKRDLPKRKNDNPMYDPKSAGSSRMKGFKFTGEEVEQVDEADSLAAMAARREKRLAAQRKKMGTSSTGQDFGHDYGISSAERKKRQDAEFAKFVGRGKKTTKEEFDAFDVILEFLIDEEIAQDIQEANWIMANAITEEQIDEILGMFKKKPEKKTEYAGKSMKKPVPNEKEGYTVDKRRPEVSVSGYDKGGKTFTVKTRGRV